MKLVILAMAMPASHVCLTTTNQFQALCNLRPKWCRASRKFRLEDNHRPCRQGMSFLTVPSQLLGSFLPYPKYTHGAA